MNPRANITVYGLWNGICNGKSRDRNCRPMGTQFNELVDYIRQSDIWSDVDIYFKDLMVDSPDDEYIMVKRFLNSGYKLPYVMINGRMRFYGFIPVYDIYNEAKRYIEYGYIYE